MARHEVEALWALAAGELDAEARARVEAHLAGCEECARRLAELRETRALLQVAREEAPAVRWAEADDRVLTMATRRFARLEHGPRWPWTVAALGACVAAVLAFIVMRPGPEPRVPEQTVVARQQVEPPSPTPTPQVEGTEQAIQTDAGPRAGTVVRTAARESTRLRLPDASRLQVSADSEVVFSRVEADDVRLRVVRGRVAVQASHAQRRGFVVEADRLRVIVVGTVFTVEHTDQGPAVSVLEGKVRVEAAGQTPQEATAGKRVELHSGEHAWKHRSLSAQDRRAFEALGVRVKAPAPSRPTAAPAAMAPAVSSPTPPAPPAPMLAQAPKEDPWTPAAKSPPTGPQEVARPLPAPPEPPVAVDTPAPELAWQRFPAPREVEQRFLFHARAEVAARTCESYLVGLGEIADQSREPPFREEARYLRARCHEARFAPVEAATEYRRYLKEYPRGRWAKEARVALLP